MRGYSFRQAIDAGCEPRSYDSPVPEGECLARLDFKMWGKQGALRCFFTELETGAKFSLPAFRFHRGQDIGQYSPRDMDVDFSEPGIEGSIYELAIGRGPRGGLAWDEATLADDGTGIIVGVQ